jgi:hypothetical protein
MVRMVSVISPDSRDPWNLLKSEIEKGHAAPKRKPGHGDRANLYALRRNIFRKSQKTMGCLGFGELNLG